MEWYVTAKGTDWLQRSLAVRSSQNVNRHWVTLLAASVLMWSWVLRRVYVIYISPHTLTDKKNECTKDELLESNSILYV